VSHVLKLYSHSRAGRPPRVRWALEEAGAEYEDVVLTPEEARAAEHRERHPLGRVPALEDEEGVLWESAALCLQVADLYPDAGLIAAPGSHERGLVYQWCVFAMSELEPALIRLYQARAGKGSEEDANEQLAPRLESLTAALDGSEFLVGNRFTIADVVVGGVLSIAKTLDVVPAGPVRAYVDRLDARPAKQSAYAPR